MSAATKDIFSGKNSKAARPARGISTQSGSRSSAKGRRPKLTPKRARARMAEIERRIRCTNGRYGEGSRMRACSRAWTAEVQSDEGCSFEGGGGTVMCPRGSSSSLGESRARVGRQYFGASSR